MRETWLEENQRLVAIDNFGNDLPAVEAATKKHEAIETDIMVSNPQFPFELFLKKYHTISILCMFLYLAFCPCIGI